MALTHAQNPPVAVAVHADCRQCHGSRNNLHPLLAPHEAWLRKRASKVHYSARILYRELKADRGFQGSYETVKRFVAPLRELADSDGITQGRFETAPGQQSQIDWGQARVPFRHGPASLRIFVLTLGFSRRGFYWGYPDERLNQFLEAHERAFAHFVRRYAGYRDTGPSYRDGSRARPSRGCLRLHRDVLQSNSPTQSPRRAQSRGV